MLLLLLFHSASILSWLFVVFLVVLAVGIFVLVTVLAVVGTIGARVMLVIDAKILQ